MKLKANFFLILCLSFSLSTLGQMDDFNYKRAIENFSNTWHSIPLPDGIFNHVKPNLADIRIYGVTEKNDTITTPYILRINSEKTKDKAVSFKLLNQSKTKDGYYFTFRLNAEETINHIKLDFENQNFDWNVKLEGSQNQQQWFTVIDDYRILSIKTENTDFSFTKLRFPEANYKYFRLFVKSDTEVKLKTSKILKRTIDKGVYNTYPVVKSNVSEHKTKKTTVVNFQLASKVPINTINVNVDSKTDYYRPMTLEYLADSINTEKGWKYNYRNITTGTLHSLEDNTISFPGTIAKKLRLTIYNYDNQPLTINSVSAKGYKHQLIARFTEPANYFLVYGNSAARKPIYDIDRFTKTIPETLVNLAVKKEETIKKPEAKVITPLFENTYWLWGIMIVVMLLLGGFTIKMMNKKAN